MDWRIPYAALREAFPQVESEYLKAAVSKYGNNVHQAAEYILNEVAPPDLSLSALREASSSRIANANARSRPSRSDATTSSSSSDSDGGLTSGGRNRGAGGGRRTGTAAANAALSGGANVSGSRGSDKSRRQQSTTGNQLPGHETGRDNRSKDATTKPESSTAAQSGPVVIDASQSKTVSEVDGQSQAASSSNGDLPRSTQGLATGRTTASSSNGVPIVLPPSKETEIEELPDSSEETSERGKTEEDGKFSESAGNKGSDRYKSPFDDETDGLVASCIRFAQTFAEAKEEGSGQNEKNKLSSDQTKNGDGSSDSDKLVSLDGGLEHENDDGDTESLEAHSRLERSHTVELLAEREGDDGSAANASGKTQGTALDVVDVKGNSVESAAAVKNGRVKSGTVGGEDATCTNLSSLEGETESQKTSKKKEQGIKSVPEESMESCEGDDTAGEQKSVEGDDEPRLVGQTEGQSGSSKEPGGVDGERSKPSEDKDESSCPPLEGPQEEEEEEEEQREESSSAGESSGTGAKTEGGGKDDSASSEKQLVPVRNGAQGALVAVVGVQDLGASIPDAEWDEVNEETIASLEELVSEALSWKDLLRQKIAEVRALHLEAEATEAAAVEAQTEAKKGGLTEWLQVVELRGKVDHSKEAYEQRAGDVHGEKAVLGTEARELRSRLIHVASEKAAAMDRLKEVEDALQARISAARRALKEAQDELNAAKDAAMKALAIEEANMARVAREAERLEREAETCTKLREFLISQGKNVDALQALCLRGLSLSCVG